MQLPYVVSVADSFDFDFGGNEVARFKHLGCAYAYGKELHNRMPDRPVRVWNAARKRQEYLIQHDPQATA